MLEDPYNYEDADGLGAARGVMFALAIMALIAIGAAVVFYYGMEFGQWLLDSVL